MAVEFGVGFCETGKAAVWLEEEWNWMARWSLRIRALGTAEMVIRCTQQTGMEGVLASS